MKIKISFLFLVFCCLQSYYAYSQADDLYYSPYSYYGIGDRVQSNSLRNRALGSIGIANSSPINIVMDNPASYADLKQTTFEFSGSFKFSRFIADTTQISRNHLGFDGINFGFPASKRFTLVMGLNPYTKSGYKVKQISDVLTDTDTIKLITIRSGDGGINFATFGLGVPFFKNKVNLGFNAQYFFGNISRYKETAFLQNNFRGTLVRNRANYKGWAYQLGIMYSDSLGKSKYRIGATYQSDIKMNVQPTNEYFDIIFQTFGVEYVPFDTIEKSKFKYSRPYTIGLGVGMDQFNQFTWGLDLQYFNGSKLVNNETDVMFQKSFLFRAGLEWVPNFNEDSYWKKVAYRLGGYFHRSELKLFNQNINQMAVTFGAGFPFRRTLSRLNLFLELGQRGVSSKNLVKEIYFSSGIGVTFNETWFIKRKLD